MTGSSSRANLQDSNQEIILFKQSNNNTPYLGESANGNKQASSTTLNGVRPHGIASLNISGVETEKIPSEKNAGFKQLELVQNR